MIFLKILIIFKKELNMKKCLGIGCIFKANNLIYVGDLIVNLDDGTIFLTNTNGVSSNLKPWISLKSFEYFQNRFMVISADIDDDLFKKFRISKEIEYLIKERYKK